MKRNIFVLIFALFVCLTTKSADRDDLYLNFQGGISFFKGELLVGGGEFGYLPWDSWGLGLHFSQAFSIEDNNSIEDFSYLAVELRWFLEPVELSASVGPAWVTRLGQSSPQLIVKSTFSLAYLFALSSALAIRADVRLLLPFGISNENRMLTSLGMRILF